MNLTELKGLLRLTRKVKLFYDLEESKESLKDAEIKKLKEKVNILEGQLARERERLAYAAVVARRENIDPLMFEQSSPLLGAIGRKKKHG